MLAIPGLVPETIGSTDGESYCGFVSVQGRDYLMRVFKDEDGLHLEVDRDLERLMHSVQASVRQRLERSSDIEEFLVELKDMLERIALGGLVDAPPRADAMRCIVEEIEEVGWERVHSINEQMQTLELTVEDQGGRCHQIEIDFPTDYPMRMPDCRAATPRPFILQWDRGSSLRDVVAQFAKALDRFQTFWEVMDDLDKHLWVLEPERPSRDSCLRRFAIGSHCSLQLHIDPALPRSLPEVHFLGADSVVTPLRDRLNTGLMQWDPHILPRQNLETILQHSFPSRQLIETDDFTVECAICYTYRLDGAIPEIVCDNRRCARPFHAACLCEWLRGVPASRQAFNTLFGQCTYCSHPICIPNVSKYQ